ncbi:unnamed protein product [Larinioides sclopetarius]|uniref:NF-kappa-B-repressing factor n=1 Tax=Larinioides sclopetarius TaxID=280406 RepID=A0AAV2A7P7_9ARAC
MAEFEEYRQPWETGPHWELKREFMDKYQNDYPLDRLLCLAQAYSNIELLHCSYPEPVMREVYQLSCQLKGCKRFREAEADLERRKKEKLDMLPRKADKRNLSDETSDKHFKFIKFCSPQESSNESKANNENDKKSKKNINCDTRVSTNDSGTSVESEDLNKNSISEDSSGSALPSNNNIIFSLSHSPDFGLIQKIAAAIPKKSATPLESIETAIEMSDLENTVKFMFIHDNTSVICCQFYVGSALVANGRDASEKTAKERAAQYGLEILTNLSNLPYKTLQDIKKELENWKKATNSSLLWSEMLSSDFKSKLKILKSQLFEMEKNPRYADLYLLLSMVEKLSDEKYTKNKNMPVNQKILEVAAKLKCASQVHFFHFGEDLDTLLHQRAFHCDFIIKNIFICQSKASSKKKAKVDASEQGLKLLTHLIESCELEKQHNVQEQVQSLEINFECSKDLVMDTSINENINIYPLKGSSSLLDRECFSNSKKNEFNKLLHKEAITESYIKSNVADNLPQTNIETSAPSSECDSQGSSGFQSKPKIFRINPRLLANSRNRQLIVFDGSDTICKTFPSSILHVTANRCKKQLQYKIEEIPMDGSRNCPKMFRCVITLDGEEIGKSQGFTEKEAKATAAENALHFLQNCVYTIKVKKEIEESFVISPNHVLNAENPSSVLSESNVGCKMLKMMGWTGGGIGKTSGITEPIVANDHRFGQGLGFSNNKVQEKSFKQKIEALLKDYSQSNTTSDLIFSTEFSKEERKEIHRLAMRYNLINVSRGKGQLRQLFLGKKFTPMELLERLIDAKGSTPKYELEDRTSAS